MDRPLRLNVAWKRELPPLAVMFLIVGIWHWPLAFTNRMPAGNPTVTVELPRMTFYGESLRSGRIPIWNDQADLGTPILAEGRVGVFYPPNLLLYRLFDPVRAYKFNLLLHLFLAAVAAAVCARFCGISRWGGTFVGLIYVGQGFFIAHLDEAWSYCTAAWVPIILLAVWKWWEAGSFRSLLMLIPAAGLMLLAGHFQLCCYAFWVAALSGCAYKLTSTRTDRREFPARFAWLACSIIAGLMVAAVQLVPTAELLEVADSRGRGAHYIASFAFPLTMLASYLSPTFLRTPHVWNPTAWLHWQSSYAECLSYVGLVPLALAFHSMRRVRAQPLVRFWTLVLALSLFGAMLPKLVSPELLVHVPVAGWFTASARVNVVAGLALAMLAGMAIDQMNHERFRQLLRIFLPAALVVLAVTVLIVCSRFEDGTMRSRKAAPTVEENLWGTLARELAFPVGNLALLGTTLLAWPKRPIMDDRLRMLLVAWTMFDLGLAGQFCSDLSYSSSPIGVESSPLLKAIQDRSPGRIWGSALDMPLLAGARPMTNASSPDAQQFWKRKFFERQSWWRGSWSTIPTAYRWGDRGIHLGRLPFMVDENDVDFMRLTGMRYFVSGLDLGEPLIGDLFDRVADIDDPWLSRQFLQLSPAMTPKQERWTLWSLASELTSARGWFFPVKDADEPGVDPRLVLREPEARRRMLDRAVPITEMNDEGERIVVRGTASTPGVLVLGDLYYPGWIATLTQNGTTEPVRLERAFGHMRAIPLADAGAFEIEFAYRPRSVTVGGIISAGTAIGWCVLVVMMVCVNRRRLRSQQESSQHP